MRNNYPRCNVIIIIWTYRQSAPSPADDQVLLKTTIETTRSYFMKNTCGDQNNIARVLISMIYTN